MNWIIGITDNLAKIREKEQEHTKHKDNWRGRERKEGMVSNADIVIDAN